MVLTVAYSLHAARARCQSGKGMLLYWTLHLTLVASELYGLVQELSRC